MERIMAYTQPTSSVVEAYRVLCLNVLARLGNSKLIEVAGVTANTDSSIVAANLAVVMAQAGKNVLLIDCNLRSPKQHVLFTLPNKGLAEKLTDTDSFADFVQPTAQRNLQIITAGIAVENPVEALLSAEMETVLADVKKTYDVILLDVPAVEDAADAVALGTKTDGVLLVLLNKADKVEQVQRIKNIFTQADVPILGCVLDKA